MLRALGQQPFDDVNKRYRMESDWDMVLNEGEIFLKANGIQMGREQLKGLLPDIFSQAEFKGGLEEFAYSREAVE